MRLLVTYFFGLFVLGLKRTEQDRGGRSAGLRRWLDECAQPLDVGDDGLARSFKNMALLLEAGDGAAGLARAAAHAETIHLLLTDGIMPEMNGWDLAKQLGRGANAQPGCRQPDPRQRTADLLRRGRSSIPCGELRLRIEIGQQPGF